jgi:hypothetical protein
LSSESRIKGEVHSGEGIGNRAEQSNSEGALRLTALNQTLQACFHPENIDGSAFAYLVKAGCGKAVGIGLIYNLARKLLISIQAEET